MKRASRADTLISKVERAEALLEGMAALERMLLKLDGTIAAGFSALVEAAGKQNSAPPPPAPPAVAPTSAIKVPALEEELRRQRRVLVQCEGHLSDLLELGEDTNILLSARLGEVQKQQQRPNPKRSSEEALSNLAVADQHIELELPELRRSKTPKVDSSN